MEPNKRKGRRFVPSFIPLEKDVIKTVNTFDGDKHMRAVRKPGDSKVYLYVSPLFYIAIQDFTRGRYSKETYAKKSEFTRFMDEKIPAKTRSHIKKYVQPKTQVIDAKGTQMHLVDLPYMTDKGNIYEMPFGKKRPEGETLSTALFENKDTMNISELRTIIKEEIASRLSEDKIKKDFIKKLAIEFNDTINNWKYSLQDLDFDEAADVILMNADLPQGMSVDMKNNITTDDIITKATDIEFGMDEVINEEEITKKLSESDMFMDIEWEYIEKLDESTYVVGTDGKGKFYEGYAVYHLDEIQDVMDIEEISEADYNKAISINEVINEEEEIISNLEKLAKKIKASIDSDDRFSIYVSKVISEPGSEFKYGSYAVRGGAADYIAKMLGLDFEGEGYGESTYTTIDKVMEALRTKKLIDLEW